MKITISAIKADTGSKGGHALPSQMQLQGAEEYIKANHHGLLIDYRITHTGDDVLFLFTHAEGINSEEVHKLAWNAYLETSDIARKQGLYGAGQDLLSDSFSGNIRGLGPAAAEMEIDERASETFLIFAADKTSPGGAYNLPLYLAFADPMHCPGLILSPALSKGFRFDIMDVGYTKSDRVISLEAPKDLHNIAALLRATGRYVVEGIYSRANGEQAVAVSTSRLRNIAGRYVGKDDPVAIVRCQKDFPATGEVIAPYAISHYLEGGMRGSHNVALMPVPQNTQTSWFDGPPMVSCASYNVQNGRLTTAVDMFSEKDAFWNEMRRLSALKSLEMRRQGFFEPAMVPSEDLEYMGITEIIKDLDKKFKVRKK